MQKSVTVFCGSSKPKNNDFMIKEINKLSEIIIKNNYRMIYGGAKIGIMGMLAKKIIEKNGKVVGVIPEVLKKKEIVYNKLTEIHVVKNMHKRKKLMYELGDFFIVLPGGVGTLEEFSEILTWKVLGITEKKIFLINIDGFYDNILNQFKVMDDNNFLYTDLLKEIIIVNNISNIEDYIIN